MRAGQRVAVSLKTKRVLERSKARKKKKKHAVELCVGETAIKDWGKQLLKNLPKTYAELG